MRFYAGKTDQGKNKKKICPRMKIRIFCEDLRPENLRLIEFPWNGLTD
jgi:hypothetical protein